MELWMVRTKENLIAGPYTRDQVQKLVENGELALEDELCQGNDYWFFVHEASLMKEQLGVLPQKQPTEDDTETQTASATVANGGRASTQGARPQIHSNLQTGSTQVAARGNFGVETPTLLKALAWALAMALGFLIVIALNLISD